MAKRKLPSGLLTAIGSLADKADNFVHAAQIPVPPAIHVEALSGGMTDIRDELRKLYVELSGDNPWEGQ